MVGRGPSARSSVDPFRVMQVLAAASARRATGAATYDLTAGQPSTPAPSAARALVHESLESQVLGYTPTPGIPALREGIAALYRDRYDLVVDPASVFVTTGSSSGFILSFLSAFDVGDVVAVVSPGYPAYRNTLQALGCEVLDLPCGPQTRYQPTVAMLEQRLAQGQRIDGLIIASPANPTGSMLAPDEVAALAAFCAARGIRLISDEIYHGITYGTRQQSCAWTTDRSGIVVNSFSKYFSMTGWRIGWLLVPEDLRTAVDALAGNLSICPPAISQIAALGALDAIAECDAHVQRYAANRRILIDGLASVGITDVAPPDGAFYVYADVSHLTDDSAVWVSRLLADTGVAIAPGIDFDLRRGHRFVRFSFAGSDMDVAATPAVLGEYLTR
ncbi:aminotransferase class I/II-fold pyridoxal phosphate-dependent enzyme [Nakamurella sp. A5-74]|uniref:Aminotransferase n=1 Tax=Nakamurella sp. A5-74 TaxID=3158264 RepID=A0AAU8DMT8_9ACTN